MNLKGKRAAASLAPDRLRLERGAGTVTATVTTPGARRVKETKISWSGATVVTAELPDRHLLRRFLVYAVDKDGAVAAAPTEHSTAAAADLRHGFLARQLATGERHK